MTDQERLVETAIEIAPLLQTARPKSGHGLFDDTSIVKWGTGPWQQVPSCWQPASDPDDEWVEAELTTGII